MTILTLAVVALVTVAVFVASELLTRRRARDLTSIISDWDDWDAAHRAGGARKMLIKVVEDVTGLRRALLIFAIGVTAAVGWMLFRVQDTSDDLAAVVAEQQAATCTFLRLQNANVTEEIRQRQVRRDRTAQEIIDLQDEAMNEVPLEEVPGFLDLDEASVTFVQALAEDSAADSQAAIADAERRLAVYDEDLARLRAQVDDIRALANDAICS